MPADDGADVTALHELIAATARLKRFYLPDLDDFASIRALHGERCSTLVARVDDTIVGGLLAVRYRGITVMQRVPRLPSTRESGALREPPPDSIHALGTYLKT